MLSQVIFTVIFGTFGFFIVKRVNFIISNISLGKQQKVAENKKQRLKNVLLILKIIKLIKLISLNKLLKILIPTMMI